MENVFDEKNFGEASEVSNNVIDWGMPGDFLLGTFMKARNGIETEYGVNSIYEIYAERGSFHKQSGKGRNVKASEEETIISKGEVWGVWGRGDIFCGIMGRFTPGQVIKITYVENGGKDGLWKDVRINAPKGNDGKPLMNKEWLEMMEPKLMSGEEY